MIPDLKTYDNSAYNPGAGTLKRVAWYFVNALVFSGRWLPFAGLKVGLLRLFGARIGRGVNIKPAVNIKYPWLLRIGDYTWIGEEVWIDNLAMVDIGSNCCVSQGAMLLCGNHDYKKTTFDLITGPITICDGAWVGARSLVCPGVTLRRGSILAAGSVATTDLPEGFVCQGNPAAPKRRR